MTPPFVSSHRQAALERLLEDYELVARGGGPRMVFVEAPLGWGKTRLVHELYARLAASQTARYWPAQILTESAPLSGAEVSAQRKRLAPDPFVVTGSSLPEWVWLGVSIDPSITARPEQAYSSLASQLEPHLAPILRRRRMTRASFRTLGAALGTLLPVVGNLDAISELGVGAKDLISEWYAGRSATRTVGGDGQDSPRAMWNLLTTVWKEDGTGGPPIVFVIEDAQFMGEPTVDMLSSLLGSPLPVLVIATGWPLGHDGRYAPLRTLISSAPKRLRVERLDALSPEEAHEIVNSLHPGTDPQVAEVIVGRFAANPYALQLFLWNHDAERGQAFEYDDVEWLATTDTGVHTELRLMLERADRAERIAVLVASLLGYRIPVPIGDAAAAAHSADLTILDALRSDWMRADTVTNDIVSFVEPIRRETAIALASSTMSPSQRQTLVAAALEHLEEMLTDDVLDPDPGLLQALYVELAEHAEQPNEDLLADCICGLLEEAWQQRASQRGRWLLEQLGHRIDSGRLSAPAYARATVTQAQRTRMFYPPANEKRAPLVGRAVDAAARVAAEHPELHIRALLEHSRLKSNTSLPEFDLESAVLLYERAQMLAGQLPTLSADLSHQLAQRRYSLASAQGDRRKAHDLALAEAQRCADVPELAHDSRYMSLGDAALYIARVDAHMALAPTRDLIVLLSNHYGTPTHPRVLAIEKDLAVRLLRTYRPEHLDEAHAITERTHHQLAASIGRDARSTLNALSAHAHACRRMAQRMWQAGDPERCEQYGAEALRHMNDVIGARARLGGVVNLMGRSQMALARAWAGDEAAIAEAQDVLDERIQLLGQGPQHAEVLWLARDIRDVMIRFGRRDDAEAIQAEFPDAFRDPYPA